MYVDDEILTKVQFFRNKKSDIRFYLADESLELLYFLLIISIIMVLPSST